MSKVRPSARNSKQTTTADVLAAISSAALASAKAQGATAEELAQLARELDASKADALRGVEELAEARRIEAERAAEAASHARRREGAPRPAGVTDEEARAAVEQREADREQLAEDLAKPPPDAPPAASTFAALNALDAGRKRHAGKSDGALRAAKRRIKWQPPEGAARVPFPRHAVRLARRVASDRNERERWLMGLPEDWRAAVRLAAADKGNGTKRPSSSRTYRRICSYAAAMLAASEPSERAGFCRVVHGLPREALVMVLPRNEETGAPIHVNTLSNWTRALERAGFFEAIQPDGADPGTVERGRTGWALNQYRLRPCRRTTPADTPRGAQEAGPPPPLLGPPLGASDRPRGARRRGGGNPPRAEGPPH
jgi:hypothetical protein